MRRLLAAGTAAVATAAPASAAHHGDHVPGCRTHSCDDRIGARWTLAHRAIARIATVAPYRAWLARVARCESSNNTRAVSPNGLYRGMFQFDLQTWHSVGGQGDPINATRSEQEFRAVLLLKRRGTSPWPVCG